MAGVAEQHAGDRMEPGWHLAFAVFAAVGAGLLAAESTVKSHLLRVFEKLAVGDRTAAVTEAIARGLLPAPGRR